MLPQLVASGNAELGQLDSLRMDDIEDEVDEAIAVTQRRWEQDNTLADILALASIAASRMINSTGRQFNARVQTATGQQRFIPEPNGTAARIRTFAKRNRELISNAISDQVARIKQTIVGGIAGSRPLSAIRKGIVKTAKTFGRRLVNIARDQSEKIQSQINTARMQAVGIKRFVWINQGDDRVRPHHEEINGQTFVVGKGDPQDGMPGDAPLCRCIAGIIIPKGATPAQRATIEKNRERRLKATNRPAPEAKAKAAPKPKPAPKPAKQSETERLEGELSTLKKSNAASAVKLKETQARTKAIEADTRKLKSEAAAKSASTKKQNEAEIAALEKKLKDTQTATKSILTKAGLTEADLDKRAKSKPDKEFKVPTTKQALAESKRTSLTVKSVNKSLGRQEGANFTHAATVYGESAGARAMRMVSGGKVDVDPGLRKVLMQNIGGEKRAKELVTRLENGMKKLPKHEGKIYRGLALDDKALAKLKSDIGKGKLNDPGITSWSANGGIASAFTDTNLLRKNRVILTRQNQQGVAISRFTTRPEEVEVLHPSASHKVVSTRNVVLDDGSTALLVELE